MRTLSIIIPAYNEANFIGELLKRIDAVDTESVQFKKEVIVVDDGSTDATFEHASNHASAKVIQQENQGKGRAVQRGVKEATGDYILVQDADLEYDPNDYLPMLKALNGATSPKTAIYGSRTRGQFQRRGWQLFPGKHPKQGLGPWIAGAALTGWFLLLFGRWITDTLTAYKIYPTPTLKNFHIKTHGFETDHEIGAKLVRAGIPIIEVPIAYTPRSREEGKKIGLSDGFKAVWTMFRFRWVN